MMPRVHIAVVTIVTQSGNRNTKEHNKTLYTQLTEHNKQTKRVLLDHSISSVKPIQQLVGKSPRVAGAMLACGRGW